MMVTYNAIEYEDLVAELEMKESVAKQKQEVLTENKQIKGVAFKSTIHIYQKIRDKLFLLNDGVF